MNVLERIQHCLTSVGFPVIEAAVSTIVCVMTMVFVDLHMAKVFVKTMFLVVFIGLVHGLIVVPVVFYLISLISNRTAQDIRNEIIPSEKTGKLNSSSTAKIILQENVKT